MIKRFPQFSPEIVLLVVAVAIQIAVIFAPIEGLLDYWFTTDDAFYYFKVAQNIAEGQGSTFDGLHLSNGYHPLWLLVMVPVFSLARVDLFLPLRIVVLISILLSASSGILLYRLLNFVVSKPVAVFMAVFWVLFPRIYSITTMLGMETAINSFSVLLLLNTAKLAWSLHDHTDNLSRYFRVGFFAVVALFSRLDNAFLVLTVGLMLLLLERREYFLWIGVFLSAFASVFIAFFLRLGFIETYPEFLTGVYILLGVSLVIKMTTAYFGGLLTAEFSPSKKTEGVKLITVIIVSSLLTSLIMIALSRFEFLGSFPRLVLVYDLILFFAFISIVRVGGWFYVERQLSGFSINRVLDFLSNQLGKWIVRGLAYSIPLLVFLGVYLLFNLYVFGTPTPVSGQIKHWWGSIPDTIYSISGTSFPSLLGFTDPIQHGAWWLFFMPVSLFAEWIGVSAGGVAYGIWAIVIMILVAARGKHLILDLHQLGWIPLLAACLLQILYYNGSYYANLRIWYWSNEMLAAIFILALALDSIILWLMRWNVPIRLLNGAVLTLSLVLLVGFPFWLYDRIPMSWDSDREAVYLHEARMLTEMTPPGSVIGMAGGGAAGYFTNGRTIVNLDGLINSYDYFQMMKSNTAQQYLDSLPLNFVFGHAYLLNESAPYYTMLRDRLNEMEQIGEFTLYRYSLP